MGGYASAGDSVPGDDPPSGVPGDDFDLDAHIEWLVREIDAGRRQVPPEPAAGGPAAAISLGDACDIDPGLLAGMCGPDGLGGEALSAAFGQDKAADVLRPGPVLAALTAQAVSAPARLSDSELTGALQAARRLANLAAYQQTVVIAEFARRRQAQFQDAKARGIPVGCRAGEFPGEELAMELIETRPCAGARIDAAAELTARLPRTLQGMAAGVIDLGRAHIIASRTRAMSDADAAYADEVLAAVAPGKRPDQLAARAAALEMKLAPDAVRARRETAKQLGQRVEARREDSGNASLAGRELDTADVLASKAHIDAIAARLRDSGRIDGTLNALRALVMTDLTQGRDPLDRIKPAPGTGKPGTGEPGAADPVPLPALINVTVPAGTLLGWDTTPATAAGWGLLDADQTTTLIRAASQHPRTRWCITPLAPDGTATAHGCAKGRHPWPPDGPAPPDNPVPPEGPVPPDDPAPPEGPAPPDGQAPPEGPAPLEGPAPPGGQPGNVPSMQATQLLDLLRRLNITLQPIARRTCDHAHAEDRYVPGRMLKHLLRARHSTCTAPGCNAQAQHCDIDHAVPYPDGPTCECNTAPKCRRHHRTKQAPGWQTAQPAPDTITWTTPAGRTHTTGPTAYDL